ncbi:MAG TPA: glycosyltransferase family 39 protein, partial [Chitinophagaceae bacterium]|nr:glycosyltransferase family 39 protein [Chitinophagaceae bacterium]
MLRKRGLHFYLVLALFVIYLINGLIAIPKNSVTYDEMDHWSYGKRILMRKTEKVFQYDDASAMPITGLNAIPRAFQQLRNPDLLKTDGGFSDIMNGRYVTLIVCLLTGILIYTWSKQLFGENGGLLSLFLFVFCPNLNGHGILLTTDAYTALFTLSTCYFFWKFIKQSGWRNFILFSVSLGFAQIVKYSMIHLYVILALVSLLVLIKRRTIFVGFKKTISRLVILHVILIFIINVGFLFNHPGKSLDDLNMSSQLFTRLQSSVVGSIPLPVPEPYVQGIDWTTYMNELGAGDPHVSDANYLLGVKKTGTGFWYYYLVVFLFKTPLTPLLLLTGALIFLFVRKKKEGHPGTLLFLPGLIFYFLLQLGIQNNVQIGIRHALMVYPLLYVLCGFIVNTSSYLRSAKLLRSLFIVYSLATYYYFFPNLISYSNEFIPVKKNAYKVMADSNIDFGQGWHSLKKYLEEHPDVHIVPAAYKPGKFVIGVNDYLDLKGDQRY